jgi:hypothetical protein
MALGAPLKKVGRSLDPIYSIGPCWLPEVYYAFSLCAIINLANPCLGVRGRIVTAASGLVPLAETRLFAAQPVRERQNHWLHTAAASGTNQPVQFTNQLSQYDNALLVWNN